jgi:hypothetical protein
VALFADENLYYCRLFDERKWWNGKKSIENHKKHQSAMSSTQNRDHH